MQIGQLVESRSYPEKGCGTVISLQSFAGMEQAVVYFDKTREKMLLSCQDLNPISGPEEKMQRGSFSAAEEFVLRLLVEQVKAGKTREGFYSAGGFKILPLPHQLLAVDFVLGRLKPRALIADEVGLGKTIEAALIYEELKARGLAKRVLVIAPAGLCYQWKEEMKQKFNEEFSLYDKETCLALKNLHGTESNIWTLNDKIITSMDFIKPRKIGDHLPQRALAARRWHNTYISDAAAEAGFDLVIIDEAHKLSKDEAGEETARYKVGKALSEAAPFLLLLTATPHQGDPAKFKNLLGLVDAHLFVNQSDVNPDNVRKVTVRNNKRAAVDFEGRRLFKQRLTFLYEIERDPQRDKIELDLYNAVSAYVSDFYNLAQQMNDRTTMFLMLIYQRMVSSSSRAILKSLEKRLAQLLSLRKGQLHDGEEKDIFDEDENMWEDLAEKAAEEQLSYLERRGVSPGYNLKDASLEREIQALQGCVELARRAAFGRNDLKFEKLLEVAGEFIIRENDPRLKFIIFTEFVETQQYISTNLQNLGYKVARINGSMSSSEKESQKDYFKESAQFLVSTDAGGEGINLQFCRIMINYDLPWNPMRLEQRIGRIDRIGQEHDVKIVNFQLKGTVEQRVRDVIEAKLERIRQEFNDGEDKLADILSTLQDEFNFEKIYIKIYIDAVRKRKADEKELEEIAKQIYQRARDIIQKGELTLPFSEFQKEHAIPRRELEKTQERVRAILARYLELHNIQLKPYKGRKDVYYFEDPLTGKRFSNVFFDQRLALEHDSAQLISFNHPYMLELLKRLEEELAAAVTTKMKVKHPKFAGLCGLLVIFKLVITNNVDPSREELIPCFVDERGLVNYRISQYFSEAEKLKVEGVIGSGKELDIKHALQQARQWVEEWAEALFLEYRNEVLAKIDELQGKMEKYYNDKERAVRGIAIDNIRESKLVELEQERKNAQKMHALKKQLLPSLDCLQIAYVEFF